MKKTTIAKIFLSIFTFVIFSSCLFVSNLFSNYVYAAEEYSDSGSCGSTANWYYYEESGLLSITGSGAINSYSSGNSPWNSYINNIKKITVDDGITSIGVGAFQSCSKLQEISLPFVGASRTATGPSSTFGYIFGYTSYSTSLSSNAGNYTYDGFTTSSYVSYGYSKDYSASTSSSYDGYTYYNSSYYNWYNGSLDTTIKLTTNRNEFTNYILGTNKARYNPSGTTWQYSCYDVYVGTWNSTSSGTKTYALSCYFYNIPSTISKVTITDASKIGSAAFMNCSNITEINLNSEITSIGEYAFRNCSKLDVFDLPDNLTSMGHHVMYNCDSLTDIEIPSGIATINSYSFYDCDKLEEVKFNDNITIIGVSAFESCEKLKDVDLPENLVTIETNAFCGDSSFTKIVIPNKVQTIGECAFKNCSNVMLITFGSSVKTIKDYAFEGLTKIETINVPNNITSIGVGAFQSCSKLQEISLPFVGASRTATGPSSTFGYIFGYTSYSTSLSSNAGNYTYDGFTTSSYVSYGYSKDYSASTSSSYDGYTYYNSSYYNWYNGSLDTTIKLTTNRNEFTNYILGTNKARYNPSGTTWQYSCYDVYVGTWNSTSSGTKTYALSCYFYNIPSTISKVTITDASKIGSAAFMNCSNITEINLNSEITSIGEYAFRNCGYVNKSSDEFVVSGDVLLKYNGNASNVIVPNGIDIIAPQAFYGNTRINNVSLPESVTFIGAYAFYNCSNAIINIPKISGSLTIGTNALNGAGQVKYLNKSSYTNGNDTFYFTVNENDEAIIVGCSTTSTNITLPTTLSGYDVVKVGYRGMANCTTLTSVTIPSNIIALDLYSFYGCNNITTVTIPATCSHVGDYAFMNCTSLHSVTIAEGVIYVGDSAFYGCKSLAEIVVPDTCTYLGKYAFYGCTSLETASIGISVPDVNDYTFYNCSSLTSVVLGISVESIGDYAFYNTLITKVTTPTTLKSIGDYAYASCDNLTKVTLRNGFESIGSGAFRGCVSLNSINIVASINEIGDYAFYYCTSLTSATIPVLVNVINDYTYAYCTSLATVTINGNISSIGNKAFYKTSLTSFNFCNSLEYIGYDAFAYNKLSEIVLPDSINYLGEQAFNKCTELSNISIPDDISFVGVYAFPRNIEGQTFTIRYHTGTISKNLLFNTDSRKVIIEEGITKIGDYAFAYNERLSEIVFPSTLINVGNYAFYENRSYAEITLPSNTKTLGSYAFARGYQLALIKLPDSIETIGTNCFYRDEDKMIHPNVTIEFYYNKGVICANILDGQLMHNIIVDDQIFSIGDYAFANASNLTFVSLPDSISTFGSNVFKGNNRIKIIIRNYDGKIDDEVYKEKLLTAIDLIVDNTEIGDYAFYGSTGLKTLTINGASNVGDYAFSTCTGLQTVLVNDKCDVGDYAFYKCTGLQKVTLKNESNIGDYAFAECVNLNRVDINDSPVLGAYAFYNDNSMTTFTIQGEIYRINEHCFDTCKSLRSMQLPLTVNYIGEYAFYDCNSMTSINIPLGIEKILTHTFYGCSSLKLIDIPNTVDEIQDYAFYGCIAAETINISANCESIGDYTFYNCKLISTLIIPDSVQYIGEYAFRSCLKITELRFSDNVEEIGACAFYDCNALEKIYLGKKIIELKDRLFYACVNLTDLYVYAPLSYIDELAFYGAEECVIHMGYDTYMINRFDELGMNYEIDSSIVYEYKVMFVDWDDSIISSLTYNSGDSIVVPTNPTRDADNTYTYVFKSWDKEVVVCGGNTTYKALYDSTYIEYTITFVNYDDTELSSKTYHYGDTVEVPQTPAKPSDNTYSYTFAGWDKEVTTVTGNTTYKATYTPVYIEYTIAFNDYDGTEITSAKYHYGDTVTTPANPTREADNTYTYVFKAWDKEVVTVAENTTYTATYTPTYIEYTVVFKNYDGTELLSETYHYGDTVTEPTKPTKASDETYDYEFVRWDKTVTTCDGDKTYTAVFTPVGIEYTITFVNYDDTELSSKTYHYGDTVEVPQTPAKPSDNTYSYTFAGWDKEVTTVTGNTTYKATYTPVYIEYTIAFNDYDGTEITSAKYHYGDTVTTPANPTREADNTYTYVFKAWDKEVVTVAENTTYTATYTPTYIEYTVVFKNYDGTELLSETYHYGDTVTEPTKPTKASDETYDYEFVRWDKTVTTCDGDKTYTAVFTPVGIEYTITFVNYDDTELSSKTYHYGDTVEVPQTPAKPSDNTYSYTFAGWDKEVTTVTGNTTYKATYTPVYIEYTIAFNDYDGTEITSAKYHYGDTVTTPANPTREADNTYTYVFKAWDKEVVTVAENTTYTATYTPTYIEYTVVFKNYDGTELLSETYHYGDTVTEPTKPTKASDETYDYEFVRWDKTVTTCDGDKTYTAVFTQTENAQYKSTKLLNELISIIDSIQTVNLDTYQIIVSIQEQAKELTDSDKIKLNTKLQPVINQYVNYVQVINSEYEVAESIESNYFLVVLEMINYISILGYALLLGKRWF